MYSLFRLLFQNHYWRMLLRKATWYEAWLSLTRAHKDRRARRHLLQIGLLILVPFMCLAYLAWLVGTGAWLLLPFLIAISWWIGRRRKLDEAPIHIAPQPEVHEPSAEEKRAMRRYFAETTLLYAVMVDRAGSERFLKEKTLPEGFEVISRRAHLELLKSADIWDRMAKGDREALMMPDGHWDWERINQVALGMEPLRLLRWMLQIDFFLPVVGQQLKGDFELAHELVLAPKKALEGEKLAEVAAMEIGRDAARVYFQRCLAEAINRGYYDPGDEASARWAKGVSEALGGQQHEDLVLGGKLVSEVSQEQLMWATSLSHRRENFLAWAISVVEGGKAPEEMMAVVAETAAAVGS